MKRLIGIDPDTRRLGVAVADLGERELRGCWSVRGPDETPLPACPVGCAPGCRHEPAALWLTMVREAIDRLQPSPGDLAIIEGQFLAARGGYDPRCILDLASVAGAAAALLAAAGVVVVKVQPRAWRGFIPKPDLHCRILASLNLRERDLLPRAPLTERYLSDPLDAAGLALHGLRRLGVFTADPSGFARMVERDNSPGRRARPEEAQQALVLWGQG